MARGLLGKKIGMTQVFDPQGDLVPATVIALGPNHVLQVKSAAGKDGYNAVKVGFEPARISRVNRPELGVFKAASVEPTKHVAEFRVSDDELAQYKVGESLTVSAFSEGETVNITGTSKGAGFQGVVKRHKFKGAKEASHGTHEYKRHGGSIGCSAYPGRVIKGKKMAGQMGNRRVTVRGLKVLQIFAEDNLMLVKGSIPGAPSSLVRVCVA